MNWPGMGDPSKRKQTLKFLIITAAIAISVAAASTAIQGQININNPLKVCINDRYVPYEISATLELFVDGQKADIPAKVGFADGCKRSMFTLADDGKIYAQWEEEYPFELGHFLWIWEFPLRDMDESKSSILVDGKLVREFIRVPFVDGEHYVAKFTSKVFDDSKDRDFLPADPIQ
ncbi:MAG: hypothetical protein K8823_438 [Cenarchaeum symbiont of Oopsacas minuta]|nr:hypothetical protein [Cenarchaeum symbiont of Oopsacas minuta]